MLLKKAAKTPGQGIMQGPDDRGLGEESSSSRWSRPGDTSEPKTAKTIGQGIMQGPDDHGLGEESSSSRWSRPGGTSEPKTAKTIGQGIMQGPDDCGLGEESSSSRSRPGETRGLTVMVSLCATGQQHIKKMEQLWWHVPLCQRPFQGGGGSRAM